MYFAFVEAGRDHLDGVAVGILGRKGDGGGDIDYRRPPARTGKYRDTAGIRKAFTCVDVNNFQHSWRE